MAGVCSEGNVSSLMCCVNYVKVDGVCKECALGHYGVECHLRCPDNYFGRLCKQECNCKEEYICHFENGCISSVSNENNESPHEASLGTLELIGILSIGSLITVVVISLLLCIIKNLGRRKKVSENVNAFVNLLRPHLRSDHHCYTPCDTSQGDQGAVGGSVLVPVVKDGCMRKSVNEYATIETFSHYHTLSSLSKWRRSRSSAIHNVLRRSISLTGMDSIEVVHEEKKSVFSDTVRHSAVFFKEGRRSEQNFAPQLKMDFEPSSVFQDETSPCEQDMPDRDKIEKKYEFNEIGENWKMTNNADECSMDGSCMSDVDAHSDSEREYSKLNSLSRDYHLYGKTRSRSLRNATESVKEDPTRGCLLDQCAETEEASENSQVVVPKTSDIKGKRNRKLYQNDSTVVPSGYEFHRCNDNETSFISSLPGAGRRDKSAAMGTQFEREKFKMSKENKLPFSCSQIGDKSNVACKNSADSIQRLGNKLNSDIETRKYPVGKENDPGYEYGMNSETEDPNIEYSLHCRQVEPTSHSIFRPYSVVNKSSNIDTSAQHVKLPNETLMSFPSARPYSVVAKKKERVDKNSEISPNVGKFEHENSGFSKKKSDLSGQNAFTESTLGEICLPDIVFMNENTQCESRNCDSTEKQTSKACKKKKVKPSAAYCSMKRKVPTDISTGPKYTMKDDDYLYEDYTDSPKKKDKNSKKGQQLRKLIRKMSSSSKENNKIREDKL